VTRPSSPHTLQGILLGGAGAIAFSGKAIIVKLSYRYGVDAVTVIMYRMLFALPLFLALSWWAGRGKPALTGAEWRVLGGLGFTGYYLASFLDFSGLQYIGANLERLIIYLNPTIVLALSAVLYHVRVTPRQLAALAVSYTGVLLVFGHDFSVSGPHVVLGSLLVLGSAVSYALYLAFSGPAVKRLGALRVTGVATGIACVLCIAQFFVLRPVSAMAVAPQVIGLSILNATLCTFLPVLFVMMAVERIGAPLAAQMSTVGPIATIFMSVLILDEPFTRWVVIGTVLVLVGIWLLTRWKTPAPVK
jgi:drug/metabolite transporter (DMT)-like permease